ncbi:uncharacterized protein LOC131604942 [Vicia villosa]|uniref:uncharacterized protein LOC131604942 n=1 Tax=Vicia villosa TaxID=3911 RepID=UPI00273AA3D6|nr:uncharacterized protein LOC131604942 [Vicia villosa]
MSTPMEFVAPKVVDGEIEIEIDGDIEIEIREKDVELELLYWDSTLILYALGGDINMNMLKHYMERIWNFVQLPDMVYHEEGYFILKFRSHSDKDTVLMKGPHTMRNMPLLLRDWKPGFNLKEDMLRTFLIWVKLPQLPLHLWGVRSLNKIGSALGNPLVTDECTASKARVSYAQILVEVDVTQELNSTINIKDMEGRKLTQPVKYEWKPIFCGKCQKFGHNCKEKIIKKWQPKPIVPAEPKNPAKETVDELNGPEIKGTTPAKGIEDINIKESWKEWETML